MIICIYKNVYLYNDMYIYIYISLSLSPAIPKPTPLNGHKS